VSTPVPLTQKRIRVVLITNIPTPYRIPIYEIISEEPDIEFQVVFCSGREPDRAWDLQNGGFRQVFLKESFIRVRGRFIHANSGVWPTLRAFKPDVVVTTGFNPTHLIAFAYACRYGAKHIAMTDGTLASEAKLAWIHRVVRRIVFARTAGFVGASNGSLKLYCSYGVPDPLIFKSHLCTDNARFAAEREVEKRFDLIFCGRFVEIKNPLFALQVARKVAYTLGHKVSMVFVGSGEMEDEMRAAASQAANEVECSFPGFALQRDLPQWYCRSRVFLFPTQWEPWGVVVNEACAAGLPVVISPTAGSADELVLHGDNGYVLPLNVDQWVDAIVKLLSDEALYSRMAKRSTEIVKEYSYLNAARGLANACRRVMNVGQGN
jgi:glycosyltransferase involved in cell wall biosynthesis